MNHPSDYMNNYQDSLSSDSSNPTIPINPYHKNKPTYSLHQPKAIPSKKPSKPRRNNKKDKNTNSKAEKRKSASEYLILGDAYYNSKDVKEITRRFMLQQQRQTTMVMKIQRLKRKQEKSIAKIQTYIQTFVQNIRINYIIRTLAKPQKYQLYTLLKSQQQKPQQQEESIDQFFQCAVEKLEIITNTIENEYPHKNKIISKWKNLKMHQLSTAKSFLSHEVSSEYNCNFQNELEILQQQKFFPELKEEIEDLRFSIINYLKDQQQREVRVEDEGVKWVLNRLLSFVLESQIVSELANKIEPIINGQCQLLDSNVFILFERQVIGTGETQQQSYIHIFNKSVFDLVNQLAPSLLHECEQTEMEGILRQIFSMATVFEKDELQDSYMLLKIGDVLFDFILQEALWDFLQYL